MVAECDRRSGSRPGAPGVVEIQAEVPPLCDRDGRHGMGLPHGPGDDDAGEECECRNEMYRRPEPDQIGDGAREQSAHGVAKVTPEAIDAKARRPPRGRGDEPWRLSTLA